jgi:hypothetical protein
MNMMAVRMRLELLDDLLQALFEVAAVARPASSAPMSSVKMVAPSRTSGTSLSTIFSWRALSAIAVFPHRDRRRKADCS